MPSPSRPPNGLATDNNNNPQLQPCAESNHLFQLLLRAKLVGVSTLLLTAVDRTWGEACLALVSNHISELCMRHSPSSCPYVALPADHLLAVVFGGKSLEGWLNDTTAEAKDQVQR